MKSKSHHILVLVITFACSNLLCAQVVPLSDGEYAEEEVSTDFTDEQVVSFNNVRESITALQFQAEKDMEQALKSEGMTMQQITELTTRQRESVQNGTRLTEQEAQQLAKANEQMQRIQLETQPKIMQAIEDEGLAMEEYQNMLKAYQTNEAFKNKVKSMSSH